jgi:Tfp pilus assembly protein PilF
MARMGKMTEAADYLQRALRISPEFSQARKELERIQRSHPSAVKSGN